MNKKYYSYTKSVGILILVAVILATIIETLIFNFSYFTVDKNEKGLIELNYEDLKLNNIDIKGNEFIINGDNPSFEINSTNKVLRLKIGLVAGTGNFNLQQEEGKFEYKSDTEFKDYMILKIENEKSIKIKVAPQNGAKSIFINSIQIDNEFCFNYVRFIIIASFLIVLGYFIFFNKIVKEKLHVTFFVIVILFGSCLSLLTPTYFPYDEKDHFVKAYQTSRGIFGFTNEEIPIKWIDNSDDFLKIDTTRSRFNNYQERLEYEKKFASKEYSKEANYYTSAVTYLSVPYLPSALGIFIGRLIGLSFIHTFYLGRIFSVIAFAIVGAITIKKVKVAKRLIFAIGLFPAILYLAASYSADPMTLIFSLAGVGVFLNMLASKKNEVDYRHVAVFGICIAIAAMSKVPYALLGILVLVVPKEKFKTLNKNKVIYLKFIALAIIGGATIAALLFAKSKGISQWKVSGANDKQQLLFILHNPLQYAKVCIQYISKSALSYFEGATILLCYVKPLDTIWLVYDMAILFVLSVIDNESHVLKFRWIDKGAIFVSIAAAWGLVITALYLTFSPVGAVDVSGVQGRYFAPLMLPFLLLFRNNNITHNFKPKNMNFILSIVTLLPLLVVILKIFVNFNA
ncbi:DUF2142 domain-containing protein [Clostridium sp. SHJSY1]|uniref:DUF2142 domain-containing protein n=1 Tax=Clostridium sp. SHJSY1 TaxID=2942483 RepID=UPI0028758697|nr:DUF2142 domain-containing protein [Clostridium sp. SHJSY1]MDS0525586.1 DUF2142 domain-containing protein [Clostridium sp. SHJSY1]